MKSDLFGQDVVLQLAGTLLKYAIQNNELDNKGFKIGQVYEVKMDADYRLYVVSYDRKRAYITDENNLTTPYCDNLLTHVCPVILPRGNSG